MTAHHHIRNGREPVAAHRALGHAANFLYMLKGEDPSEEAAGLMDTDMILHAEHGSNASSFTGRVVVSTEADLHAAMTAAIAALSGPAHGGAAENVMKMAQEIGDPAKAAAYVRTKRKNREPIMGFGHRVYKAEDPRAKHLRERSRTLSEKVGQPQWFQILTYVEEVAMVPYRSRGIFVNVDFFAGSIYYLLGIPDDLFISIFALGRIPGWTLQCMEQFGDNILIRPLLEYTGEMDLEYVSIEQRA